MYTTQENKDAQRQAVEAFRSFDADTQLGVLWFGYLDVKDQLTPGNANSSQKMAEAVFNQIQAMSKEEQLQAQRDIASRADTPISHQYGGLDPSAKLDVWLRLAQGIDNGTIIEVPSDYKLPSNTKEFTDMVKSMDFEQRLDLSRALVIGMGAGSNPAM